MPKGRLRGEIGVSLGAMLGFFFFLFVVERGMEGKGREGEKDMSVEGERTRHGRP